MKLGVDFPQEWRKQSEKSGLALSDILYGYALECLVFRLEKSTFCEYLWLTNENVLGEEAYKKNIKERLAFFYIESGRKLFQKEVQAGNPLSLQVVELLAKELLESDTDDFDWTYYIEERSGIYDIIAEGHYQEMRIPVVITLEKVPENAQRPKRREFVASYGKKRSCSYWCYSKENILAEALFEVVRKLELIGSMEAYSIANEILKTQSISGRHIMENFKSLSEKEPKVLSMKRLEQLESYKKYAYMKRRWEQYEKRQGRVPEDWEQVSSRVMAFLGPMWKALCENEIFFDDWMPELGRFLG